MKILLVAQEFPFPPYHGGRVDSWNRIKGFKELGHEVFLITWHEIKKGDIPNEDDLTKVREVVDQLITIPIRRDIRRILNLSFMTSLVAARDIRKYRFNLYLKEVVNFKPDVVFIDGIYAGATGFRFADLLKIPAGVRLHNIEHLYMAGQFRQAISFREKLSIKAAQMHLKRYEFEIISRADVFFDISLKDLKFWERKGMKHGIWLPPVIMHKREEEVIAYPFDYDVGFVGNLNTPNNVQGLFWFVQEVLPIVKETRPDIKVLFLGSNPGERVKQLCEEQSISLIPNPPELLPYIQQTRMLINPVKFGSGVNIKTIDMLFMNKEVVSTSIGIDGLPKEFDVVFKIADDPVLFAREILSILRETKIKIDYQERLTLRQKFAPNILNNALTILLTRGI